MNEQEDSGEKYLGDLDDLPKDLGNFDNDIMEMNFQQSLEGGAHLDKLPEGKTLVVKTQNTTYRIEKRPDGYYISGHPKYCPTPIKINPPGSSFGSSSLKPGYIGRGMFMEFGEEGEKSKITSAIQDVYEE